MTRLVSALCAIGLIGAATGCAVLKWVTPDRPVFVKGVARAPYVVNIARDPALVTDTASFGVLPVTIASSVGQAGLSPKAAGALVDLEDVLEQELASRWGIKRVSGDLAMQHRVPDLLLTEIGGMAHPGATDPYGLLKFYVFDGYPDWKQSLRQIAERERVDYFVFVSVGVGTLVMRPGVFLSEISLGSGYSHKLPTYVSMWTTSRVHAVMLCGALVDARGEIVRAAAEGLDCSYPEFGKETGAYTCHELADMLEETPVIRMRREDLPGSPLTWQVAADSLRAQLLRGPAPKRR